MATYTEDFMFYTERGGTISVACESMAHEADLDRIANRRKMVTITSKNESRPGVGWLVMSKAEFDSFIEKLSEWQKTRPGS